MRATRERERERTNGAKLDGRMDFIRCRIVTARKAIERFYWRKKNIPARVIINKRTSEKSREKEKDGGYRTHHLFLRRQDDERSDGRRRKGRRRWPRKRESNATATPFAFSADSPRSGDRGETRCHDDQRRTQRERERPTKRNTTNGEAKRKRLEIRLYRTTQYPFRVGRSHER